MIAPPAPAAKSLADALPLPARTGDGGPGDGDGGTVVVGAIDGGAVDAGNAGDVDAGTVDGAAGDAGGGTVDGGDAFDGGDAGDAGAVDAGCVMRLSTLPEQGTWHVDAGISVDYDHNPPASGPHWPIWATYTAHDDEVPREVFVHNLEHGAVVLLAGPNATPEQVQQMRDAFASLPFDPECVAEGWSHKRALYTYDSVLDDAVAVVAWDHVLESTCVNDQQILDFVVTWRAHGDEDECADGQWP